MERPAAGCPPAGRRRTATPTSTPPRPSGPSPSSVPVLASALAPSSMPTPSWARRDGGSRLPPPRARLNPRALHGRRAGDRAERRGDWQRRLRLRDPRRRHARQDSAGRARRSSRTMWRLGPTRPSIGRRWARRGSRRGRRSTISSRSATASCWGATCCWRRRSASRAAPGSASNVMLGGQVGVGGHLTIGDRRQGGRAVGHHQFGRRRRVRLGLSGNREHRVAQGVGRVPEAAGDAQTAQGARAAARGARDRQQG